MPNLLDVMRPDLLPPREQVEKPLNELVELRGKRIAVTGGHGPNLGQAIVHRLAGIGASLALVHRAHSADAARAVAAEVTARWGVDAVAIEGDMTDWDGAHQAARDVVQELGGLDVWINSAGAGRDPAVISTPTLTSGTFEFIDAPQSLVDQSLSALLQSVMYGTHAALSVMLPQRHGRIINIASAAAFAKARGQVCYATMKAGVSAFTELVAREIGPAGVSIVCVAPGTILSGANMAEYVHVDEPVMQQLGEVMDGVSLGRCAWPEEPANMIAFLASDAASYVHGTTIRVSGGR